MNTPNEIPEIDWTILADPYEIAQLREQAKWPLWEKLEWLESAQLIAQSLERSRLRREEQEKEPSTST